MGAPPPATRIAVERLDAFFGAVHAVRDVSVDLPDRTVTAIIGPSGCGKSTFLRCLNRMHETIPGARVGGRVILESAPNKGTRVTVILPRDRLREAIRAAS